MKGQDGLAGQATPAVAGHRRAYFTGVPGNYLLGSVIDAGLDLDRFCLRGDLGRRWGVQRELPINI